MNCLCSDVDVSVSRFSVSSDPVEVGEGLSPLGVAGDDPSEPDADERFSGELW